MRTTIRFTFMMLLLAFIPQIQAQNIDAKGKSTVNTTRSRSLEDLTAKYDVTFYFLDLNVERTGTTLSGNTTIEADVVSASLDTFAFELLSSLAIDSIKINQVVCTFSRQTNTVFALLGTPLTQNDHFSVTVYYHGTPTGTGFFSGISNDSSPSWGNQVTWTLSEPFSAHFFMPCKQVLTDKADSSWVFITTDSTNMAGSNGLLTAVTLMGGGKARYEWKSNYPIVYYLISFTVTQYVDYSIYAHPVGAPDSVLVQNFVYNNPNCLPYFKDVIDQTPAMIELYSELMGTYPFHLEKYGHCMAPFSGGMEHQTMTSLGFFEFYLVAHELAHQWFGDNVTCGTWNDIWINEGFAVFTEFLAGQYLISNSEMLSHVAEKHDNVMSEPGGSVFIQPWETLDDARIFDGRLSYDKGGSIVHTLRFVINNDSTFFDILRGFQADFAGSTAIGEDFRAYAESLSGLDLETFFDQWYYGEGFPTWNASWDRESDTVRILLTQTTSTATTTFFETPLEIKFNAAGGDTVVRVYNNTSPQLFSIPFSRYVLGISLDPNNWIINGAGSIVASTNAERTSCMMSIFPNPAQGILHIVTTDGTGENYVVSDLSGREVLSGTLNSNNEIIDLSGIERGLYIISVDGYGKSRFIVQ
ncbi:MAG: T9SS type A sorting domain-containing protein [Bacteroidetes bacterium]|nr:T9SS type A sorting domain-containing protein [Bacteroidota bacterium]MBU1721074.1 T9SS type A sorting domain-containing protein [Bacteroidota bacterium]